MYLHHIVTGHMMQIVIFFGLEFPLLFVLSIFILMTLVNISMILQQGIPETFCFVSYQSSLGLMHYSDLYTCLSFSLTLSFSSLYFKLLQHLDAYLPSRFLILFLIINFTALCNHVFTQQHKKWIYFPGRVSTSISNCILSLVEEITRDFFWHLS